MIDFVYNWNYTLTELPTSNPFYDAWGNPSINTTSNLLQLTYDDIVIKTNSFTSATGQQCYYIKGNVCPQTSTSRTLMFQPTTNSLQNYPSIRGANPNYILGGSLYQDYMFDSFGSFGCLSGQSIPQSTLSYGMFVNVTESKLAFVVTNGVNTYNSGFVHLSGSGGNILKFALIAQNAPFGSEGSDNARLTSIYGSYQMTVDELMEVYNEPLLYVSAAEFNIIPESQYASIGDTVTFRAGATPGDCSVSTISWSWYKDGELIPGVSGSAYTISGVGLDDYTNYQVGFTSNLQERLSPSFNLFGISGLIFELDKNCSPSPGYFRIYDRTISLPTSSTDYEILFKIEDSATSGSNYRSFHQVEPWGSFEVQLFGIDGTTYNISMSASYDLAPEGG